MIASIDVGSYYVNAAGVIRYVDDIQDNPVNEQVTYYEMRPGDAPAACRSCSFKRFETWAEKEIDPPFTAEELLKRLYPQ